MNDTSRLNSGDLNSDFRARQALQQAEADERRRSGLLELTADANAPAARIRAWERAYRLTLPSGESHPVLASIAAATHLTVQQVRDEQIRRATPAPSLPPTP
jgi:hypothetical protein